MKQLLILLLAVSSFAACKDKEKNTRDKGYDRKEREDYRSQEENGTSDDKDSKNGSFTDGGEWSSSDIRSFNSQCMQSMEGNEELANKICPCALEKFQKKYSSLADMDKNSSEAEGKRIGEECAATIKGTNNNQGNNATSNWPESEKNSFLTNCEAKAVEGGGSRSVARSYCQCILNKLEAFYPDMNDVAKMTESDLERFVNRYKSECIGEN
ncbi:MAG: hypothetical protein ABL876_15990 [Chitinophagaceae bacterium]